MTHYYVGGPVDKLVHEYPGAPFRMIFPQYKENIRLNAEMGAYSVAWEDVYYHCVWQDKERAVYVYP